MPDKEFTDALSPQDEMFVRIVMRRGVVHEFTVQYLTVIADKVYGVVRYDNAHDYAHRDLLDADGETISKTPVDGDLAYALQAAIRDVKRNWRRYRADFLRRMP